MKTQVSKARFAILKLAMICLLLVNTAAVLQAQPKSNNPKAEIKYVGVVEDKYVFEVVYPNDPQNVFSLEIKDEQGFQFYFGKFKQKSFKKQYAIDKYEVNNGSITFVLATPGGVQKQSFDINSTTRTIDEVSVVKL
ncbi:MAG TPA: hypothetical protein VMR70_11080 [Flavisolibacter sp.]|nr:hypothetical protein [Flavisolibacter sp.]